MRFVVAIAAALLAWRLKRLCDWRYCFRWMLIALVVKAVIYGVASAYFYDWLAVVIVATDTPVMLFKAAAVLEVCVLLLWPVPTGERMALLLVLLFSAWFAVEVVAGRWDGAVIGTYTQLRLDAHITMATFVLFGLLWGILTEVTGQIKSARNHAIIMAIYLLNNCWTGLIRPESADLWFLAEKIYPVVLLSCLCLWWVTAKKATQSCHFLS